LSAIVDPKAHQYYLDTGRTFGHTLPPKNIEAISKMHLKYKITKKQIINKWKEESTCD
jgi:hypothetical protein